MSDENLIHIKLNYSEAFQSKRDVLSSEIAALKIAKHVKAYRYHRDKEFELKILLYKKIKELRNTVINLQKVLPKLSIPSLLRKEGYNEEGQKVEKKLTPKEKQEAKDNSIEDQLWEIQRKLNDLQSKNF